MRSSKKLTTRLLPTLLVMVAMLLAACGGGSTGPGGTGNGNQPEAPASQQNFRFYGFDAPVPDITTLDPGQVQDAPSIGAIELVFTGLVQLDDKLNVVPQMATWDKSADGLTWTFHLKPNLKFSDGTNLTSDDVVYSIDRALSPTVSNLGGGVAQTYLGLIKDSAARLGGTKSTLIGDSLISQPSTNTVVIKLSKVTPYWLDGLAYPTSFVVEKSVADKYGPTKWIDHLADNGGQGGDGPFKIQSYDHATGITFVPNTNWYGPKVKLQKVQYLFFKDVETLYKAYQANQVDYTVIPAAEHDAATQSKEYSQHPELVIDYAAMNYNTKPFDSIHIRRAFELALNKDLFLKAIYHGTRSPTCHIVPSGMYGYAPNLTCPDGAPTSGDAAKAQQELQMGLKDEGVTSVSQLPPIKFSYSIGSQAVLNEITTLRQEWKQVLGIDVGTNVMSFTNLIHAESASTCSGSIQSCQGKGLQLWAAAWGADYPDPQDWLTLQFGDNQPYNEFNYGNNLGATAAQQQALQKQMDALDVNNSDPTARAQGYNQAEQQLVNDVSWLPIDQRTGSNLTKPYVVGLVSNGLNEVPPGDWGNIYIAAH